MRVAVILLACAVGLASAQFPDGNSQRGPPNPIRSTRFQRLPAAKPSSPVQSVFANQRIRRPISFSPRGGTTGEGGPGIAGSPFPGRLIKPALPATAVAPNYPQHVKPVSENTEEDDRSPENEQDDQRSLEQDRHDDEDESDESISRTAANIGSIGTPGFPRSPGNLVTASSPLPQQPPPVQYRNFQGPPIPTGRGVPSPTPIPYRPPPKPTKPRKQLVQLPEEATYKQQIKPVKSPQVYDARGKKPVAQIIRRYRNDNDDGSITWGFENDDGSYKEEIIGVDCITRGKYGYVDPDGLRREYTYETGIKCDEEQREEEEENGFVDYQENKLVLPDGKTIDLSTMGKKQARRPRPSY